MRKRKRRKTARRLTLRQRVNRGRKILEMVRRVRSVASTLREYLEEAHTPEVEGNHGGDGRAGCSYCEALGEARRLGL